MRGAASEKDIMVDRVGEETHLSESPVMHHLSIPSRKGAVADEWLCSQEMSRAKLSPRHWKATIIISWLSGSG